MIDKFISISTNSGMFLFSPFEIIRCQASNNYTWFYLTGKRKVLVAKTMGKYETALTENNFIKIHRTDIINKFFISNIKNNIISLTDGTCLTISKRRRTIVRASLQIA